MKKYFAPIFLILIAIYIKDSNTDLLNLHNFTSLIIAVIGLYKGWPILMESFSISDFFVFEKTEKKEPKEENLSN